MFLYLNKNQLINFAKNVSIFIVIKFIVKKFMSQVNLFNDYI